MTVMCCSLLPLSLSAARDSGIHIHGWKISRFSGSISSSVVLDAFQEQSKIHCPEMTFLDNHLTMKHEASGVEIKLEAKEALKACATQPTATTPVSKPTAATTHPGRPAGHPSAHPSAATSASSSTAAPSAVAPARLQVAAASKWNTKSYEGLVEGGVKQVDHGFDWTYTTKYKGELLQHGAAPTSSLAEATTAEIPLAMLQRPDPILWYDTLPLFEDELHDNGVASLTVRVRVMDTCFLVLLQFWLRVDDTIVRVYDTRLFHAFGTDHLIREQTCKEDTFDELQKVSRTSTRCAFLSFVVSGPR